MCIAVPSISFAAKVLEYRFDDPSATLAVDTSGNNLDGTFVGSSIHLELGLPGHGYGVSLNGVDDFINSGDPSLLDISKIYTLMAWINYSETTERNAEIMEKGGAYWLNIRMDTKLVRAGGFFKDCNIPNQRLKNTDSQISVPTNTWSHIASTYNGTKLNIFVNGQLARSFSLTGNVCVNNNQLAVGAKYVPAKGLKQNFVKGMMDDVRIYNNALSVSQIQNLMVQP